MYKKLDKKINNSYLCENEDFRKYITSAGKDS